ncbi:hypothetical protein B0H21DRAFT_139418 [Amylocystis lapponica]|nr:hypothetical protein B0H21DRAFT_139418 [Amylocystis lapponica]
MGHYTWGFPPTPYSATAAISHPQYKPLSWRTTLCRHFAKNRGWCPLGDDCNYIHDLTLADAALEDVRFPARHVTAGSLASYDIKVNDGIGQAATKHSHCWAYVQGLCNVEDCPYLHPAAVYLFVPHTPCLVWPNCHKGTLCPYKHPEPIIRRVPMLPSPPRMQPPSPRGSTLSGAYQYSGTTYFPVSQAPQTPFQAQAPRSMWSYPYETWRPMYNSNVPPGGYVPSSPEAPPWIDSRSWDNHVAWNNRPQWEEHLAQPRADPPIYEVGPFPMALPPPPRKNAHAIPATPQSDHIPGPVVQIAPSTPSPSYPYQPLRESNFTQMSTKEDEFPYVPQKNQRVGHARRVSVTLKSKEDSDAFGLVGTGHQRESWKTHGDRFGHRSWAPSTTSVNMPGAAPPPPLIF